MKRAGHDALSTTPNRSRCAVPFLRRVLVLAFITGLLVLTPAARARADACDARCQQVRWYWAASLTEARQWYATVIYNQPWVQCVLDHESRTAGLWVAYDGSGNYGAFQDARGTWTVAARWAGRPDLVGRRPDTAPWWDQLIVNQVLEDHEGMQPWNGDGC